MYIDNFLPTIHDCIENAIEYPLLTVTSAELTSIGTIGGEFLDINSVPYEYEMTDDSVIFARSDGMRMDAAPKGKKCPGGYWISRNKKCKSGAMSPSAKGAAGAVKAGLAAAALAGAAGAGLAARNRMKSASASPVQEVASAAQSPAARNRLKTAAAIGAGAAATGAAVYGADRLSGGKISEKAGDLAKEADYAAWKTGRAVKKAGNLASRAVKAKGKEIAAEADYAASKAGNTAKKAIRKTKRKAQVAIAKAQRKGGEGERVANRVERRKQASESRKQERRKANSEKLAQLRAGDAGQKYRVNQEQAATRDRMANRLEKLERQRRRRKARGS